jgi:hypothetical protein
MAPGAHERSGTDMLGRQYNLRNASEKKEHVSDQHGFVVRIAVRSLPLHQDPVVIGIVVSEYGEFSARSQRSWTAGYY